MDVHRLLPLILALPLVACANPEVSTEASTELGLTFDRYVVPAQDGLPDPQSSEERARAEFEWPAVAEFSQPWRLEVRQTERTAFSQATPATLPKCGTLQAERGPCRGVADPPPIAATPTGPVILRAEATGYEAPRLTLFGQ